MCIIIEYQIHVMVPAWHTVNKLFSKLGINDYIFAIHNMLPTKYTLSYPEVKPNMVAVGCLVPQSCPFLRNPMDSAQSSCCTPLFLRFPRQECWSGLPFPSP